MEEQQDWSCNVAGGDGGDSVLVNPLGPTTYTNVGGGGGGPTGEWSSGGSGGGAGRDGTTGGSNPGGSTQGWDGGDLAHLVDIMVPVAVAAQHKKALVDLVQMPPVKVVEEVDMV